MRGNTEESRMGKMTSISKGKTGVVTTPNPHSDFLHNRANCPACPCDQGVVDARWLPPLDHQTGVYHGRLDRALREAGRVVYFGYLSCHNAKEASRQLIMLFPDRVFCPGSGSPSYDGIRSTGATTVGSHEHGLRGVR